MRRVAAETGDQCAPGLGILAREAFEPIDCRFEILADAEPAIVAKGGRKTMLGRHEAEAMAQEFVAIGLEEGRARKEIEIGGEEIMPETGQCDLARPDRAAGFGVLLEDGNLPALARQMDCRREPIMPGADDDRVVSHGSPRSPPQGVCTRIFLPLS